jgi:hypothetical protein
MTPGGRLEIRGQSAASGKILNGSGLPYLLSSYRIDGSFLVAPPVTSLGPLEPGQYILLLNTSPSQSLPFSVQEGQTATLAIGN